MTAPDPDPDWLGRVAAPLWQMLTGIGQLRAGETLLLLGGDAAERAFVADAACLLGAAAIAEAGEKPAQLVLVLGGSADPDALFDAVAPCGRVVVRAGRIEGRFDIGKIAARGLTVRGFDPGTWAARQPEQLRDIVAALESCRGGPSSPLVTLGGRA